ncbi:MAG: transcription-repair coupling factor [Rickettsiales bacterium]|nr:transcription-repair coupling factor [Rickettsiales bacterium]
MSALTLAGVPKSAAALAIAELLAGIAGHTPKRLVYIATSDKDLNALAGALGFFVPDAKVIRFSAWDCMPYDRSSPHTAIMSSRILALSQILRHDGKTPLVVVTTTNAIIQQLPQQRVIQDAVLSLAPNQDISQEQIITALLHQGYRRAGKAMEPGEFAVRGSIFDIMAPGMNEGIRIDFFGDTIETLRAFDPLTQVSQGTMERADIYPVSEVLLNDTTCEHFRARYRELFGAVTRDDPLYESIAQGQSYPGMEHWLPLFYPSLDTLFDYCKDAFFVWDSEAEAALSERFETIRDYYQARIDALGMRSKKNSFASGALYNPLPPEQLYLLPDRLDAARAQQAQITLSPFSESTTAQVITLGYKPVIRLPQDQGFEALKERVAHAGKSALLACYSRGSLERLQTLLSEQGMHCLRIDHWDERKNIRGKTIGLAVLPLESGFETDTLLVLSEQDVLGERIIRTSQKKKKSDVFLQEAANFTEGELITHKEHGIGRFDGLVTLTVGNAAHDCLKLVYADDDKLFLPVENIELLSRFGLEEDGIKLDKLGGASWQSRKARLKQKILMAAAELLKIAAERTLKAGTVIEAPPGSYDDFCSRFPYIETEDQERAIADVIEDLHKGKPMDRLVCGDVGFGKTEVALRAAFVATSGVNKVQVAVVTPTTLLARQHYHQFKKRFEGFPVEVRQLSRMVPAKAQKETRELLKEGKVDIVIGTHALLAKQVEFANLGLMIVDEEQHFGVAQKEKLKGLKSDIHVLTLSATPIPRTLQMALTGVRDLSLITTPPVDRLAVRSFVMPIDPVVMREAMLRELHRGGRCFVVCPRIKDIAEAKAQITDLVPEAKLVVAHGQLPPSELDSIMNDFYDGTYDVLLSTAIIESGLDIPTANTMIIYNAHLFGLSQLYQLRGRVGRGKTRAYAYFLLPHHRQLTKNATRRLEVMQTLDTLGAGFTLASHDMDIRGFGNLVGEEQSGHIREVGIELYQQMLEEAVEQLKHSHRDTPDASTPLRDDWSPQINLAISVLIPESYVDDLQLRLGLYRRAAGLTQEEDIHSFAAELTDRFGDMPEEVRHLIATLTLKIICKKAGIERIDVGPKGAVLSFKDNQFTKPEALLAYVAKNVRELKVRPDQKLVLTREFTQDDDKLIRLKKLISDIAALA